MVEKTKATIGSGGQRVGAVSRDQPRCYSTPKPGGGEHLWLDGRRVASIDADHVLRRTLHGSRHLYRGRGEESWSFHTPVILEGRKLGAQTVEVKDDDTGLRYRVDLATFCKRAISFANAWGPQLALALRFWRIVNPAPAGPRQLSLFDEGMP